MMRKLWAVLVGAVLLAGCNPYQFTMGENHVVPCEIMTPLSTVDPGPRVTTIRTGGAIDMSYYGVTQYLIRLNTQLISGEGYRILIRPVVEYRDVKDSGISINVTRNGSWIESQGKRVVERQDVKLTAQQLLPVSLLSDHHLFQVVLGCDTIYKGWSTIKESDDIFVQSLGASEFQVLTPYWDNVPGVVPEKDESLIRQQNESRSVR